MKLVKTEIQETIHSADGSSLGFWFTGRTKGEYALVIYDDAGYTSVPISKASWELIKARIDALILRAE